MKPALSLPARYTFLCLGIFLGLLIPPLRGSTIAWTNTNGGLWSNPSNWSPNVLPQPADAVQIAAAGGYTVTVDTNVTIASLTLGGVGSSPTLLENAQNVSVSNSSLVNLGSTLWLIGGTWSGGLLTVDGLFYWSGATVSAPVTVTSNAFLSISGFGSSIKGPLTNSGTMGMGSVTVYNNNSNFTGAIYNLPGGLIDVGSGQNFNCFCYGFESFNNAGTVRKSTGDGTTTIGVPFTNSGTVDVQNGNISFKGGGNLAGHYNTASGGVIGFDGGSYTQTGPVTVTGSGTCQLTAGSVTLQDQIANFILAGGYVMPSATFQTNGTIQSLQLDGSYLAGTNVVTGTLRINGGGLGPNWPLTIATNGVLNLAGSSLILFGPLTNAGTVNWSGGSLTIFNEPPTYSGTVTINRGDSLTCKANKNSLTTPTGFRHSITLARSARPRTRV